MATRQDSKLPFQNLSRSTTIWHNSGDNYLTIIEPRSSSIVDTQPITGNVCSMLIGSIGGTHMPRNHDTSPSPKPDDLTSKTAFENADGQCHPVQVQGTQRTEGIL